MTWLKLGDSNNAYFFAAMKNRMSRNQIVSLKTEEDILLENCDDIQHEILSFYKDLLVSTNNNLASVSDVVMAKGASLSAAACDTLLAPITYANINRALNSIDIDKAPGI